MSEGGGAAVNAEVMAHIGFDFDEGTEVRKVSHASVNPGAYLVAIMQRLPRVFLNLLHSKTDATSLGINAEHFNFNGIAWINNLAGMLDAFRPAHFRYMHKPFDAVLQFYKSPVVCNAGDATAHPGTDRETLLYA